MSDKWVVSLDLGGTRIRTARLNHSLDIVERYETLTGADDGFDASMGRIIDALHKVMPADRSTVQGIGVSAPGPLDPSTGVLVAPPNLPGWVNVPLAAILRREFGVPVYCGNDANVAALAETARGAAYGYRYVIYITISTGIGSGIINDGVLLLGKRGLAAEAGHIQLVVGDTVTSVEKEAAGPALARRVRGRIAQGAASKMSAMVEDIEDIDARIIGIAAHEGDPVALEAVEHCGFCVGLGLVTLLHLFNPEIVVIGGGVSNIGALLFDKIRATVETYALTDAYWRDLQIVPAGLGGDVSIVGAGALVLTGGGQKDVTQVIAIVNE
ncbi:ROK family protein [Aggregatilineales bacterium SYSU G02658]